MLASEEQLPGCHHPICGSRLSRADGAHPGTFQTCDSIGVTPDTAAAPSASTDGLFMEPGELGASACQSVRSVAVPTPPSDSGKCTVPARARRYYQNRRTPEQPAGAHAGSRLCVGTISTADGGSPPPGDWPEPLFGSPDNPLTSLPDAGPSDCSRPAPGAQDCSRALRDSLSAHAAWNSSTEGLLKAPAAASEKDMPYSAGSTCTSPSLCASPALPDPNQPAHTTLAEPPGLKSPVLPSSREAVPAPLTPLGYCLIRHASDLSITACSEASSSDSSPCRQHLTGSPLPAPALMAPPSCSARGGTAGAGIALPRSPALIRRLSIVQGSTDSTEAAHQAGGRAPGLVGAANWAVSLLEQVQVLQQCNSHLEQMVANLAADRDQQANERAAADAAAASLVLEVQHLRLQLQEQQEGATESAKQVQHLQACLAEATSQREADQQLLQQLQQEAAAAVDAQAQLQAQVAAEREVNACKSQELASMQQLVVQLQAQLQAAAAQQSHLLQQQQKVTGALQELSQCPFTPSAGSMLCMGHSLAPAKFSAAAVPGCGGCHDWAAVEGQLRRQLEQVRVLYGLLQQDYSDLELLLRRSEQGRREAMARYAFTQLDKDVDGLLPPEQLHRYEVYAPIPPLVLQAALAQWQWSSGTSGRLSMDDFIRLTEVVEDRSSPDVQRFWFNALDLDGDGYVSPCDMKQLYDAVDKSGVAAVVPLPDLMEQIYDMVGVGSDTGARARGFSSAQLRRSKLGPGVVGLLMNHGNMLLQRTTAEWGRTGYLL